MSHAKTLRLDLPDGHSVSESGAKDTRSPDASRLPGVLEVREAFGVRARSPPLFGGRWTKRENRSAPWRPGVELIEICQGNDCQRNSGQALS